MFPKHLRLITFDATNTLLNFRLSRAEQYTMAASKYGNTTINVDSIAQRFKENYKAMSLQHPNFGRCSIGWENWWTKIVVKTFEPDFKDTRTLESISKDLIDSYRTQENWIICEGCVDLLDHLKENHVKLGVISNFDPRLTDLLKDCKIHHYFDFILTSYDANCMKPNRDIYERALKCSKISNIEAKEALHVGDDIRNDYIGAKSAGWNAFIVNSSSTLKDIDTLHLFNNLPQLKEYFKQNTPVLRN